MSYWNNYVFAHKFGGCGLKGYFYRSLYDILNTLFVIYLINDKSIFYNTVYSTVINYT